MSLWRLTATVTVLLVGTALAVAAYLDTQHGTPSTSPVAGPILEFGPSHPMPRPFRSPASPAPSAKPAYRSAAVPASASRQEGATAVEAVLVLRAEPAAPEAPAEPAGWVVPSEGSETSASN